MKKALNTSGVFISVILSILLFVTLIASPLINMISSAVQPDTIQKIIEEIDFVELVLSNKELQAELAKHGIDVEFLEQIKESEILNEGVDAFIEGLFEGQEFTKDTVVDIIEQRQDEAVYYIKELSKRLGNELHELPDEEVKQYILDSVDKKWQDISASLPTPEDLGITQEEYDAMGLLGDTLSGKELSTGQIAKVFYDGEIVNMLLIAAAVLSALILLLRFPKCKGFLWLFIVYIIAALFTFGVGAIINAIDLSIIPELQQLQDEVLAPIISVIVGILQGGAWTLLGLAVLWIAAYIVIPILKKIYKRSKTVPVLTEETYDDFVREMQEAEYEAIPETADDIEELESVDDILAAADQFIDETDEEVLADEEDVEI